MIELLDLVLENSYTTFYVATLLLSIYKYPKYFDTPLKYFPILLMYTILTEILGSLIKYDGYNNPFASGFYSKYNLILYNVYSIISFLYFYFVYWSFSTSKKIKLMIKYCVYILICISLLNAIIHNPLHFRQNYTYTLGAIFLVYFAYLYLTKKNMLFSKNGSHKNIIYYFSIGLIVFYIGYSPIRILYFYITEETIDIYHKLRRVHLTLIYIMYGYFIYGFVQMKKPLKF